MKPRNLIDIKVKSRINERIILKEVVNLGFHEEVVLPFKSWGQKIFILITVLTFIFGSHFWSIPKENSVFSTNISFAAPNDVERQALQAQLDALDKEIADHEAQISAYKKQGNTLQSEIKRLEAQVAKFNLQIKAINLNLKNLDAEIGDTENKITDTQKSIDQSRGNLSQVLQTIYENDRIGTIEILLKNPQLSDFFGDLNNLVMIQDSVRADLERITELKTQLVDQRETLGLQREDTAALKVYQDAQKASILQTQTEKANLLKVTKGKESEYQKLVAEKKHTAAQIRQQIFQLLGGGELSFGDAYQLAKMAEAATGVRAALLLAVLDRESALGKNVGKCSYKTAMNPVRDIPVFLQIIQSLGMEKDLEAGIIKVSCANADGAYGGAMGPAQFLPSTWALYDDRIAQISGDNPPSPWKNADAFVATALYLKDAGAVAGNLTSERMAAAKYYAGARWRNYLWTYGDRVITQAQQFEDDIKVLNA